MIAELKGEQIKAVARAVSQGARTRTHISQVTGIPMPCVTTYLQRLKNRNLVELNRQRHWQQVGVKLCLLQILWIKIEPPAHAGTSAKEKSMAATKKRTTKRNTQQTQRGTGNKQMGSKKKGKGGTGKRGC